MSAQIGDVYEHWETSLRLKVVGFTEDGRVLVINNRGTEQWDLNPASFYPYIKIGTCGP